MANASLCKVTIHGQPKLYHNGSYYTDGSSGINQIAESSTPGADVIHFVNSPGPSSKFNKIYVGSNKTSYLTFYTTSSKVNQVVQKVVIAYATTAVSSPGSTGYSSSGGGNSGSSIICNVNFELNVEKSYNMPIYAFTSTTYYDTYDSQQTITTPTDRDGRAKITTRELSDKDAYTVTGGICSTSPSSAGNGNVYGVGVSIGFSRFGNSTFYPQLTPKTYTITLDSNYQNGTTKNVSVVYKSACSKIGESANIPTRPGYTFRSWNDKADGTGTTYTASTIYTTIGNKTLYAQWAKASYILTANANNGSIPATTGWTGSGATATKSVVYEDAYGDLPIPTRANYQFVGGFTSATGGMQVTSTTKMGTRATIIYAHWEEGFKVIFDLQGGIKDGDPFPEAYDDGHVIKIYRILKPNSTANNEMQPPVRDGYLFEGYYTAPNMGGTKVYQGVSTTLVKGIANTRGYWDSKIQGINSVNNLVLYAGGRKVNSYAHDGSTGRPIRKMYGYNNGGKLIKSFSAHDGSEWKDGVS